MPMEPKIKRIRLVGLAHGVEEFIPPCGMDDVLSGLFEYQGFDYYVRQTRQYGIWNVVKSASDGRALVVYNVRQDRRAIVCDCHSGRRHLACRHKEMVTMFVSQREEGVCGTQSLPNLKSKTIKDVPKEQNIAHDKGTDITLLLARVNALLEKTDAR